MLYSEPASELQAQLRPSRVYHSVLQVCLLTKAVLVAIFGSERVLPSHHGTRAGLLLLFGAIVACSCLIAGQHLLLSSYLQGTGLRGHRELRVLVIRSTWLVRCRE